MKTEEMRGRASLAILRMRTKSPAAPAIDIWRKIQNRKLSPLFITFGAHAQRGYGSWVSVCVCVSVPLHLTSRVFIRLTKDTTYLTGNEGQNFQTVFSETAPLQS